MTQARLGYGTLIQYWDGAAFQTVAEAQSITGPDMSTEDVEVTNHDSPGGVKEYIPGLKEGGTVSFNGNMVPGDPSHQLIINDQKSGIRRIWRIVAPDAADIANRTTIESIGYVQNCSFEFPTASQMTYSMTLKIAGEPTIASVFTDNLTGLVFTTYTNADGDAGAATPTLQPAFAAATYNYGVTVANDAASYRITPTRAGAQYTLYVNGDVVDTGDPSNPYLISAVGLHQATVRVAEEDHKSVWYTLTIVKPAS